MKMIVSFCQYRCVKEGMHAECSGYYDYNEVRVNFVQRCEKEKIHAEVVAWPSHHQVSGDL